MERQPTDTIWDVIFAVAALTYMLVMAGLVAALIIILLKAIW